MDERYFASLLVIGGACIGFALHAATLAVQTRLRRYVYLMLLGILEAGYCVFAWRFLLLEDGAAAMPWGHWLCAFTPFITYCFGELVAELMETRPRWLTHFQWLNLALTTSFAFCVVIDITRGSALVLERYIETDLASLHRHHVVFTPLGVTHLVFVCGAFLCFTVLLVRICLRERDLIWMVLGCVAYFVATALDFGTVAGLRDGIYLQHFGFFAIVIGSWRVISNRFEAAIREMHAGIQRLEEQRGMLLASPTLHRQKLASLGTLAAGVAHEINNPIQGIKNYARLLKRQPELDADASAFADEIAEECSRVANIVHSLLRFGRSDDSLAVAVSMQEIIERTVMLVHRSLVEDGITLDLAIERDIPEITCRATQLQQVILNLVTNAREALRVRKASARDEPRIVIEVSHLGYPRGPWVRLTVRDNGDGFDPSLSERIFDPFFTTKGAEGTGLGLSVSHGIIHSHGGQLTCTTVPGSGSTFVVEIPCSPLALAS